MTKWRMRIAYWINKAIHTHTHSEYIIIIAFPLQQWLVEPDRPQMTKFRTRIACWIPKATHTPTHTHTHTHTLRIYNAYSFSIATMVGRTRQATDDKIWNAHCMLDT